MNAGARDALDVQHAEQFEVWRERFARGDVVDKEEEERERAREIDQALAEVTTDGVVEPPREQRARTLEEMFDQNVGVTSSSQKGGRIAQPPEHTRIWDGGLGQSTRYSNFLIQSIQDTRQEKYQIMETFGVPYLYLFGARPIMLAITGIVLNSLNFQWRSEFLANYESLFRGTRLAERGARLILTWDDQWVEGYVLNLSVAEEPANPALLQFQMQIFVTQSQATSPVGDRTFPTPFTTSIDTLLWQNDQAARANLSNPLIPASEALLAANLNAKITKGEAGALGGLLKLTAKAVEYVDLASKVVDNAKRSFMTLLAGSRTVTPKGAIPILDVLVRDPSTGRLVSSVSESETRRLLELSDVFGRPTFYVFGSGLAQNISKQYQKFTGRSIRVLAPSRPVFAPTNPAFYGGAFSDNTDEYIETRTVITETPPEIDPVKERKRDTEQWLSEVVDALQKQGFSVTSQEVIQTESERLFRSAIFKAAMIGGVYATATPRAGVDIPLPEGAQARQIAEEGAAKEKATASQKANTANTANGEVVVFKRISARAIPPDLLQDAAPVVSAKTRANVREVAALADRDRRRLARGTPASTLSSQGSGGTP